jgi:hypothetical protein
LIIIILDTAKAGYFVFSKEDLINNKILQANGNKGKMAFRLYLPDEQLLNKEASKAQNWQKLYWHRLGELPSGSL